MMVSGHVTRTEMQHEVTRLRQLLDRLAAQLDEHQRYHLMLMQQASQSRDARELAVRSQWIAVLAVLAAAAGVIVTTIR